MPRKSLTAAQNEHIRGLLRLLLTRYTQRDLSSKLDMTQGAISGFLGGHHGASKEVAERIGQLAGLSLEDVLALRWPEIPDRYPNRAKAVAFARSLAGEYLPDAIELVDSMDRNGDDLPVKTWLRMLDYWDGHLRMGHPSPLAPSRKWVGARHAPYVGPEVPRRRRAPRVKPGSAIEQPALPRPPSPQEPPTVDRPARSPSRSPRRAAAPQESPTRRATRSR